jgi:hypothetical protein
MGGDCAFPGPEARGHERLQPGAWCAGESIDVGESLFQLTPVEAAPEGIRIEAGPQELGASDKSVLPPCHCLPLHNTILQAPRAQETQMPGTATFLKTWGTATAPSG